MLSNRDKQLLLRSEELHVINTSIKLSMNGNDFNSDDKYILSRDSAFWRAGAIANLLYPGNRTMPLADPLRLQLMSPAE